MAKVPCGTIVRRRKKSTLTGRLPGAARGAFCDAGSPSWTRK
jgi:hypothetical protein